MLLQAAGRGFLGRCPACGRGAVLTEYIKPAARCLVCGEAASPGPEGEGGPRWPTRSCG